VPASNPARTEGERLLGSSGPLRGGQATGFRFEDRAIFGVAAGEHAHKALDSFRHIRGREMRAKLEEKCLEAFASRHRRGEVVE
jgi:hypothetical protein